jgi:hypothetical protein
MSGNGSLKVAYADMNFIRIMSDEAEKVCINYNFELLKMFFHGLR